jgi:hypothetical protein
LPEMKFRACVIPDKSEAAQASRRKVNEARRRLLDLDSETTRLTRQLKMLRITHWEKQREVNAKEQRLDAFENGKVGPEQEQLIKKLGEKRAELCSMKQHAKHWSKQARRYDAELKQQFIGGGDIQRILSKHPAGEVFFPPMGGSDSDDDGSDDDDYYRQAPPRRAAEVQLASSDEEEEKRPPPPPSQQWRTTLDREDNASDASSVTSPSGESGGIRSPAGDRRGDVISASVEANSKPSGLGSESSDSEKATTPKKPVPPLPDLSGSLNTAPKATAAAAAKAPAVADDVEEVSSEDIWSGSDKGSSRSC